MTIDNNNNDTPKTNDDLQEQIHKNKLKIQIEKHKEELLKLKLDVEALKKQQKKLFSEDDLPNL
ncbi:MAG: hypothetical protein ACP5MG_09760 [Verrucomicrobiia bacterium]|jgi:hypothetical protein